MSQKHLNITNLSFRYISSSDYIFKDVNFALSPGWTGIVGSNGSGKTTLLKLIAGVLPLEQGSISNNHDAIFCQQRMDEFTKQEYDFIYNYDKIACGLKARFNITEDWIERWSTLSFGERKRVQLAAALCLEPSVMLIDEPTNHLDTESRHFLIELLRLYKGTGIIVSHDRELLDRLCRKCIFISPPDISVYKGTYSQCLQAKSIDEQAAHKQRQIALNDYNKIKREAARRKHESAQADKQRSKRHINAKDHDSKERIRAAVCTSRDAKAGKLQSQMDKRLERSLKQIKSINTQKTDSLGIKISGKISESNVLFRSQASFLNLGDNSTLNFSEFTITPSDRIALTGANGSGKSSFIKYIINQLYIAEGKLLYLPQEISVEESRKIIINAKNIDASQLGKAMAVVKHLGSAPERLLNSQLLSPGEIRKLLIALGVAKSPEIIIMDEPTNHLDLPSIECLENALSECTCALLLVSHDERFLKKLTNLKWHIKKNKDNFILTT